MNSTLDFKGGRPNNRAISASLPFTKRSFVPCRCQGRGSPWGSGRRLLLSSHPADPFPTLPSLSSPLDAPAVTPHSAPTSPPPAWLPRSLLAPLVPPPPLWSCRRRRTPSSPLLLDSGSAEGECGGLGRGQHPLFRFIMLYFTMFASSRNYPPVPLSVRQYLPSQRVLTGT